MAEPNPDDPLMADIVSVSLFLFTPHVFCHTFLWKNSMETIVFSQYNVENRTQRPRLLEIATLLCLSTTNLVAIVMQTYLGS